MLTPQTCYLHEASVSNDFGGRWLVFLKNPFNLIQKNNGMKQERVLGKSHPFQTSKEILEVYFKRALRNIKLLKLRGPTQQWALFTLEILCHGEAWTSQSWRQVPNTDQANRPGLANCEATKHIFLNKHFLNQGDALWKKNILFERSVLFWNKKSNVFNSSKACLWLSFVPFIQMFTEHFLCTRHYLFLIERILYMLTEEMLYILEAKEDVTT